MRVVNWIAGATFVVLAVAIARESLALTFWTFAGPGPGFFPFWLSILMALLAAILVFQATFRPSEPLPENFFPPPSSAARIAITVMCSAAIVVMLNPLGFRLTMLAYLLGLMITFGRPNLVVMFATAFAGSFGVYHLFVQWLAVPLPIGVLGI